MPNFHTITLQVTDARSFLYGSYLDVSKARRRVMRKYRSRMAIEDAIDMAEKGRDKAAQAVALLREVLEMEYPGEQQP